MARYGERTRSGESVSGFGKRPSAGLVYGVATGGSSSTITVDGESYTLLTFTSTGTLTVTEPGVFDYVAIAPGGGGGQQGGGGAGGAAEGTVYISANQTVTIGAGGSTHSSIGNGILAYGGGDGGSGYGFTTSEFVTGGCGGGESSQGTPSVAVQGNVGGAYSGSNGGGGGGLGAVGSAATGGAGGNGGAGKDYSAWLGQSAGTTYKGGGGGGYPNGTGGTGGGGNDNPQTGGTANSGGGGGAGTGSGGSGGGSGGSGIVYVRFKA